MLRSPCLCDVDHVPLSWIRANPLKGTPCHATLLSSAASAKSAAPLQTSSFCLAGMSPLPTLASPLPSKLVERGVKGVVVDREKPGELARALNSGADALIDTSAFRLEHARSSILCRCRERDRNRKQLRIRKTGAMRSQLQRRCRAMSLGCPEVIVRLHIQPETRAVAEELVKTKPSRRQPL